MEERLNDKSSVISHHIVHLPLRFSNSAVYNVEF